MAIKYTSIFHCKCLQILPRLGFFCFEKCHLATLTVYRVVLVVIDNEKVIKRRDERKTFFPLFYNIGNVIKKTLAETKQRQKHISVQQWQSHFYLQPKFLFF
jgi:hypothetical protein